ncbi:MAG: hypothetical protein GC162_11710 [Planctomycetes bacterium]|nr:hypothetical protein [Planctomycetota bacterium]
MTGRDSIFLIAVLAATLAGCDRSANTAGRDPTDPNAPIANIPLIAQPNPPLADLPVPVGFWMLEKLSRAYEANGVRFVDHMYRGNDDKLDVERFYRMQMPLKGWVFRDTAMVRGMTEMHFDRGKEMCTIDITGFVQAIGGPLSTVHVVIAPVGATTTGPATVPMTPLSPAAKP